MIIGHGWQCKKVRNSLPTLKKCHWKKRRWAGLRNVTSWDFLSIGPSRYAQVDNRWHTLANVGFIRCTADYALKKHDKWSLVVCVFTTEDARARKCAKYGCLTQWAKFQGLIVIPFVLSFKKFVFRWPLRLNGSLKKSSSRRQRYRNVLRLEFKRRTNGRQWH